MMIPENKYKIPADLQKIAEEYGRNKQLGQLQEECAEVIVAVNKWRCAKTLHDENLAIMDVAEEIGDVLNVIDQVRYLCGNSINAFIDKKRAEKIKREIYRIDWDVDK